MNEDAFELKIELVKTIALMVQIEDEIFMCSWSLPDGGYVKPVRAFALKIIQKGLCWERHELPFLKKYLKEFSIANYKDRLIYLTGGFDQKYGLYYNGVHVYDVTE